MLLRRSILVLLLICLGCSAQSAPPDVTQRIERQVRKSYNIPTQVKILVGPLKPSEFPNYDSVTITFDGGDKKQEYDFFLSKDGKTLVRMTKLDVSKDPYAETMKKIDTTGRPTRGNKDAKVVAINYDDFQCPFCSRMHQTLFPELLKQYGDRVLFIYKDFPLAEIHPWATHAAVDANCLGAQNNDAYWDFADYIHLDQKDVNSEVLTLQAQLVKARTERDAVQRNLEALRRPQQKGAASAGEVKDAENQLQRSDADLKLLEQKIREGQFAALDKLALLQGQKRGLDVAKLQSCMKAQNQDAIKASLREGEGLGVSATPTLFINGQQIDGAVPVGEIRSVLDRALQQAGVPVPAHPAAATPASGSQPPSQ